MPNSYPLDGETTRHKDKQKRHVYPFTVEGMAAAAEALAREEGRTRVIPGGPHSSKHYESRPIKRRQVNEG